MDSSIKENKHLIGELAAAQSNVRHLQEELEAKEFNIFNLGEELREARKEVEAARARERAKDVMIVRLRQEVAQNM